MPDTIQFLLWFLGVPAALVAVVLAVFGVEWAVWHLGSAAAHCHDQLTGWRMTATYRSFQNQDRQEFLNWMAVQAGTASTGSGVDETLLEAQRQADLIRILVEEELPKAVRRCVETHRLMATVTGAFHMSEIAYEPECYQLRAATVWLLSHTVDFFTGYPLRLEDTRLIHNSIVLRKRALPTCRRCPYVQQTVDQAGPLCPTAELVQLRGGKSESIR
jgi:hypothetical protein